MKIDLGDLIQRVPIIAGFSAPVGDAFKIVKLAEAKYDEPQRLLLVHGYLNSESSPVDYQAMLTAARRSGWNGEIHGLFWNGGDVVTKLKTTAKRLAPLLVPVPGPQLALVALRLGFASYSVRQYWGEACSRADATGVRVGEFLRDTESDDSRRWLVAAHSLGCRLVYQALDNVGFTKKVVRNVLMFGGALSRGVNWDRACRAVEGDIVNCYSGRDQVLNLFFRVAQWQQPIGLAPVIERGCLVRNHDCTKIVSGHFRYHHALESSLALLDPQHP